MSLSQRQLALLLIAPGLTVTLIGAALVMPVLLRQLAAWKLGRTAPATA
jgi:UPF0716 family protein affecting phage T7 exclusion